MSESDPVEEIKERKREQLRQQAGTNESTKDESAATGTPAEPVHVESADHFADLTGDGVVLVDFYADWCGPCKQLEPIVESLAAETPATVAKVDIDQHQNLAAEYGVRGVPTLLLFADGEPVERLVGMQEESQLRSLVESYA